MYDRCSLSKSYITMSDKVSVSYPFLDSPVVVNVFLGVCRDKYTLFYLSLVLFSEPHFSSCYHTTQRNL